MGRFQIRRKVDVKRIVFYLYGAIYSMCQFHPVVAGNKNIIKMIMQMGGILCLVIAISWLIMTKAHITNYDIICAIMCISMAISALMNLGVLAETLKMIYKIINAWVFLKYVMIQTYNLRCVLIKGMTDYLVILCVVSTIHILIVGGQAHGNVFLLGSDNGIANIYFFACFITYFCEEYYRKNTYGKIQLLLVVVSTIVYAFVLEVGTAVLWVLAGGTLYIISRFIDHHLLRLQQLIGLYAIAFVLLFVVVQTDQFTSIVNTLFYGKIDSITSRMAMWKYFIEKMRLSPFFGFGAGAEKYSYLSESLQKWYLVGNNHNVILEPIYHYGYVTFLFFIMSIILTERIENKSEYVDIKMGVFFFLFLVHGILEMGFRYSILYTTLIYYFYYIELPRLAPQNYSNLLRRAPGQPDSL